ncbi:unnamed protein product, partial [Auanema sp. JU1783]
MQKYYPSIITFIPIVIPLICRVDALSDRIKLPLIYMTVDNKLVLSLWDSGSSISYIRESTLLHLGITNYTKNRSSAATANGTKFHFLGHTTLKVKLADYEIDHEFMISRDSDCPSPALLGLDLMKTLDEHNITVSLRPSKNRLLIGEHSLPLIDRSMLPRLFKNPARIINIINTEDRIIPPNGTVCLTLKIDERLKRNEWVCIKPTEDHA